MQDMERKPRRMKAKRNKDIATLTASRYELCLLWYGLDELRYATSNTLHEHPDWKDYQKKLDTIKAMTEEITYQVNNWETEDIFKPLLEEAMEWMNNQDFDRYLSWNDERFKTKWDIIKYNEFQSYHGGSSVEVERGQISFEPQGLHLKIEEDEKFIPIAECRKMYENQGKTIIRQESLF